MKNNLFIISGPSGAGEDTIIRALGKLMPIERVITTTSRKIRAGDSEGSPYYFITRDEFEKGIKENKFFEWAQQYNNNLYGVTHQEIKRVKDGDKIGIWKIEYKGVKTAKKKISEAIAILISAPIEQLEGRLRRRGNISEEQIKERSEYTKEWYKNKDIYDYEVINDDGNLEKSIKRVINIIKKELDVDNK